MSRLSDAVQAINETLQWNDRTSGKEVGDVYVGPDIVVISLRDEPMVIEGEWEEVDRNEIAMEELIELHQRERGW